MVKVKRVKTDKVDISANVQPVTWWVRTKIASTSTSAVFTRVRIMEVFAARILAAKTRSVLSAVCANLALKTSVAVPESVRISTSAPGRPGCVNTTASTLGAATDALVNQDFASITTIDRARTSTNASNSREIIYALAFVKIPPEAMLAVVPTATNSASMKELARVIFT